ncbi:type II CAAX prenyl endopeptidase Rce1 family protein [Novosphingobium sp.]|uniref:CPBP family glutamic-type intramembrane protease n=1 Tax=Novosphingobium sp. TaxID=1874826 RepID=UPI003BA8B594
MTALFEEFSAWLARPWMFTPSGLRARGAWRAWRTILGLHLVVLLLVLLPLLGLWQKAMGLPSPEAFDQVSKAMLVPFVVLLAPVAEELAFRGWLTGRVRALWLVLCGFLTAGFLAMVSLHVYEVPASFAVLGMGIVAPAGWWLLRRRGVLPGFERAFPVLVWLSIAVFGLSHLSNYPKFSLALLPMVLPQIWAGMTLSYTRMRIGIVGSMLIHAAANGISVSLALLGV